MESSELKNIVYEYILNRIISREIKPGDPIVEQDISKALNISRTPIREALKTLEAEGLVKHYPSRGNFVSPMTAQDVEEIFELRKMFELAALKQAITYITDDEINALEKDFLQLKGQESSSEETKKLFYDADRNLHATIMKYSGNSRMIRFNNTLLAQFEQVRLISSSTPNRLSKSTEEHLAIVAAIKERNLDKATVLMSNHLDNVALSAVGYCKTNVF